MKKALLMSLSLTAILVTGAAASAVQIQMKNGILLKGEIVSSDTSSLIIQELDLGLLKLSQEKILKIEPLNKELKEEKVFSGISRREKSFEPYPRKPRKKKPVSINLGGGLGLIEGGDLNGMIKDYNQLFKDYGQLLPDEDLEIDWSQFRWSPNFSGEFFFNFSRYMSVSLAAGYLTKTNPGNLAYTILDSWTGDDPLSAYQLISEQDSYAAEPEHKLTVIPLTLSFYLYLPMDSFADFYIKAGAGYYSGKLEYRESYQSEYSYQEEYYDSGDNYLFSWIEEYSYGGTLTYEAKSKTIGFHAGAGFDLKFSSFLSLVIEGGYRWVEFTDWEGEASDSWSYYARWGWTDIGLTEDSGSQSDSWDGKIWHHENYDPDLNKSYANINLYKEEPQPDEYTRNIRPAEIKMSGLALRAGIKISF